MADITGNYRNTHVIPTVPTPIHEDNLELAIEEEAGSSSSSTSRDASTPSRTEYTNNNCIKKSIFSEFIEEEEESREKCIKVFNRKLTESLYPTTISYKTLENAYKTDKVGRQKFYRAVQKSGAKGLYLGSKLDPRYQIKDFVITIEQDTGRFFLDSPFGRRSIKSPKNLTKLFDKCCISKEETFRAAVRIAFHIAKYIFIPHRVDKTDPFIRLEDYLSKKWHLVDTDLLTERDERSGVHYRPIKNIPGHKVGYMNPPMFASFQIQDIEKELRYRQRS